MEFVEPGITLLHFTPLNDDSYCASYHQHRSVSSCLETVPDTGSGCNYAAQAASSSASLNGCCNVVSCNASMPAGHNLDMSTNPVAIPPPPYSYACGLPMDLAGSYSSDQMQPSPAPTSTVSVGGVAREGYDELGLMMSNSISDLGPPISDLGPPPSRLPRLERPLTVDVRESSTTTNYPCHPDSRRSSLGPHSSPQSPMIVDSFYRKGYGFIKSSHKNRNKNSHATLIRSSSPMFPDQSTPLSNLGRHYSTNNITSFKAPDKYNALSSTNSDSGIYSIAPTAPSCCSSAINSPSVLSMDQGSPGFDFNFVKPQPTIIEGAASKSFLELEMPTKHARRISELDKKILKLQADRSKILEKVHQAKQSGMSWFSSADQYDMDILLPTEKPPEMGKVKLYIFPLGIRDLDEPLYDEANRLLRKVGGLYLDLQTAVNELRNICCKGMFILADISTCFSYIKSLLQEEQKLKLSKVEDIYNIQLDDQESGTNSGPEAAVEIAKSLEAANQLLRCAQHITRSYTSVQTELLKTRQMVAGKVDECDSICQRHGVAERERTTIRAVMEGNCTTMASAERVWPQYYQVATDTISIITECIHPTHM